MVLKTNRLSKIVYNYTKSILDKFQYSPELVVSKIQKWKWIWLPNQDFQEEWKDIYGYEGFYQISNMGRVKSLPRKHVKEEKILTPTKNKRGYLVVDFLKDKVKKHWKVHRLVAIHFISNPENKPEVNHIFGDKDDNRFFMLQWSTEQENREHAINARISAAKLSEEQVIELRELSLEGHSSKYLAEKFSVSRPNVRAVINRKTWKQV